MFVLQTQQAIGITEYSYTFYIPDDTYIQTYKKLCAIFENINTFIVFINNIIYKVVIIAQAKSTPNYWNKKKNLIKLDFSRDQTLDNSN